ncbi:peptidase inhibitor family I36 protein [Streptomyces malaysiensis]|uniref:Peptidase inhibitor family I36 protein n=1 Tax=Streptomyces malaysiensis subsp. samsunensis TaxID=459658 RepID=A0A9X2LV41_STRMQ|nr:peptidase inhibitor family I36 protein [Streptomyces samsunensis]MCQ8830506.1 peptidase inhibitor family I36 protein [Streptomyces samsunensis]
MRKIITAAVSALALTATLAPAAAARSAAPPRLGNCAAGQLCLWRGDGFTGARQAHELADVDIESCVPLPAGTTAASLANRTGRPVTAYQSRECAETAEFHTYPTGSWSPETPYQVRAFKIWEG